MRSGIEHFFPVPDRRDSVLDELHCGPRVHGLGTKRTIIVYFKYSSKAQFPCRKLLTHILGQRSPPVSATERLDQFTAL